MPNFRLSGPAAALVIAVLVHLAGMLLIKGFGTTFGIRAMLVLASLLAIASIGQTLAILLGGIDLSIPFVIGFANVAAAQLYAQGVPFAFVLPGVILTAMGVGALNGALSSLFAVHPLIVTLGTGTALQGTVQLWTRGFPTGGAPPWVQKFVSIGGSFGPLPFPPLVPFTLLLAAGVVFPLSAPPPRPPPPPPRRTPRP